MVCSMGKHLTKKHWNRLILICLSNSSDMQMETISPKKGACTLLRPNDPNSPILALVYINLIRWKCDWQTGVSYSSLFCSKTVSSYLWWWVFGSAFIGDLQSPSMNQINHFSINLITSLLFGLTYFSYFATLFINKLMNWFLGLHFFRESAFVRIDSYIYNWQQFFDCWILRSKQRQKLHWNGIFYGGCFDN